MNSSECRYDSSPTSISNNIVVDRVLQIRIIDLLTLSSNSHHQIKEIRNRQLIKKLLFC